MNAWGSDKKRCVNLGCGCDLRKSNSQVHWTNTDRIRLPGVDVIHDLDTFPYPFETNTFDVAVLHQALEHLRNSIPALEEVHRICKPGAKVLISVPYFASCGAFCHMEHRTYYGWNTFDYFTRPMSEIKPNVKYKLISRRIIFSNSHNPGMRLLSAIITPLINCCDIASLTYQRFFCFILPSEELRICLEVEKDE